MNPLALGMSKLLDDLSVKIPFCSTEYCRSVTIVTNPERAFLTVKKHTSIDKSRVFSYFSRCQIFSCRVWLMEITIMRNVSFENMSSVSGRCLMLDARSGLCERVIRDEAIDSGGLLYIICCGLYYIRKFLSTSLYDVCRLL